MLPGCTSSGTGTGMACANIKTETSIKPLQANIFCDTDMFFFRLSLLGILARLTTAAKLKTVESSSESCHFIIFPPNITVEVVLMFKDTADVNLVV